jgi:hypothetical protein
MTEFQKWVEKDLPRNSGESGSVAANIGPYYNSVKILKGKTCIKWDERDGVTIPFVMSFNIEGLAYNDGFKNPIGFLPARNRASFNLVITDEKIGVLAEVPPKDAGFPPKDT